MRAYFDLCHVPTVSRQLTHEKMEIQRKQLPAWYPQAVWDEIEDAIDQIDLPLVALPVYRKHVSAELADRLIKFFATKPGQDVVEVFMEQVIRSQHAGISPAESHKLALAYLTADKNGRAAKLLAEMTPSQRAEAASLGVEYKRMQPTFAQIQKEYSEAVLDKQTQLMRSIAVSHQAEIENARQRYEESHPADNAPN